MDHQKCHSNKGKSFFNEIIEEYISKQNLFDPAKPSPNKFLNKLEYRMQRYYKDLYNNLSLHKK